jgi:hypothetical protein
MVAREIRALERRAERAASRGRTARAESMLHRAENMRRTFARLA